MDVPSEVVRPPTRRVLGIAASDGESPVIGGRSYADSPTGARRPVALATRFGIASGSKAFTALTVIALVSDGRLSLDTGAGSAHWTCR
jgi:CubicO group peptidase (beta-lactamase class C family)